MLGYYVFNMIWIPLGQDACNVCICHGRAQLGFVHQFVKPSRKNQFMLTQRDCGAYPWAQEALVSWPSPPCARCVSKWCRTVFVTSASGPGLNFHQLWRRADRWLGWRMSWAGAKLSPGIPGWAVLLGKEAAPPVRACWTALAQMCSHPVGHRCSRWLQNPESTFFLSVCPRAVRAPAAPCCWKRVRYERL